MCTERVAEYLHGWKHHAAWLEVAYIASSVLFILALRGLGFVPSARMGNIYGTAGMILAIVTTWASDHVCEHGHVAIAVTVVPGMIVGWLLAIKVTMLQMPQLVGMLNALGGLAAVLESLGQFMEATKIEDHPHTSAWVENVAMLLGVTVGSVTFFGSVVAAGKLHGTIDSAPQVPPKRNLLSLALIASTLLLCLIAVSPVFYGGYFGLFMLLCALGTSAAWGIMFSMAIGGADMPVVICVLNTCSGFSGVFAGMMVSNKLLIIAGSFVGASGFILSYLMCVAMNRSLFNVLVGGFGDSAAGGDAELFQIGGEATKVDAVQVAEWLAEASSVVVVPGYGMAVSKAQHAIADITSVLRKGGKSVRFAIHPVAGRMPGHMNVLLAEAHVPYDLVLSMDEINMDFPKTDVVLVVGANDTVNPAAETMPGSAIYGMPVLQVWKAKQTVVLKRSLASGYAGVDNPLFFEENNAMLLGDAKKKLEDVLQEVRGLVTEVSAGAVAQSPNAIPESSRIEFDPIRAKAQSARASLTVGVVRERHDGEKRVALSPEGCYKLLDMGIRTRIESGAGLAAGFLDTAYTDAGAWVGPAEQVVAESAVLCRVREPRLGDLLGGEPEELTWCSGKIVIATTPPGGSKNEVLEKMRDTGARVVLDLTCVPRTSKAQKLDILSSMGKIAGHRAVLEAAQLYQGFFTGEITAAGKFPPCRVMILGVGVAGLSAISTASALGAEVFAWDVRDIRDQVTSLGAKWIDVDFKEDGAGSGGYAKESSRAFQEHQWNVFHKYMKVCNIVITTAAIPGRPSPVLIKEWMLQDMQAGSVIIDLGALGGGNCEATKMNECYLYKDSVWIFGYTDMQSRMARQASEMYSNNLVHLFEDLGRGEGFEASMAKPLEDMDDIQRGITVVHGDAITFPPPRLAEPSAPAKKKEAPKETAGAMEPKPTWSDRSISVGDVEILSMGELVNIVACSLFTIFIALTAPDNFVSLLFILMLACAVGLLLVGGVQPALHTPLMSVSNAISGQVILGGMFQVSAPTGSFTMIMGSLATFVACINITGGFAVTQRMLGMYKAEKKGKPGAQTYGKLQES